MIFRQLFDDKSSTYTYLLADEDNREAVLIDPVFEQFQRDTALVRELELTLLYTLETHVHADHVTAAWLFGRKLGSKIVVGHGGGAEGVDVPVKHGDVIRFGAHRLGVRSTPGHTDGCVTYVLYPGGAGEPTMAFTGDALLVRSAGRTDFQQGDAARLYRSVHEQIFTLPKQTLLYPAHDYNGRTSTSVAEEKKHNPRLGGQRSERDFVGYMNNLGLPHPKQIDRAVPANLRCGRPEGDVEPPAVPAWAPVVRTFAGVPEVDAGWLVEHRDVVELVDVREADELEGELGHIEGAKSVPLSTLRQALKSWNRERPRVTICRSGGRSAQAALILEKEGFTMVANLAGGVIRWRNAGYATVGARPE
jgi:glyoxylase-like metal-dependent hydrolase (beta-lactamase superfamily II)/rhodanese-related sulfurtransferase